MQVLTWVPQNDILAHPNLRGFLSHVGINSMYEVMELDHLHLLVKHQRGHARLITVFITVFA